MAAWTQAWFALTTDAMDRDFRQNVAAAADRPEVRRAVRLLYADIQKEIDARRPICILSGRCCHFEEYGHRMFVTTLEMACFYHDLQATGSPGPHVAAWDGTGCPFQHQKLCSVHAIRPMGCRLFFCDASAGQWQNDLYERFHAQLKRLHESLEVPYRYLEWRAALQMAGLVDGLAEAAAGSTTLSTILKSPVAKTDAALTID
jgi:Fe-S-cluster containining protein